MIAYLELEQSNIGAGLLDTLDGNKIIKLF